MFFNTDKRVCLLISFTVSIITVLVYLPSLTNGFVNWDDDNYVYENPDIQSLDIKSLKWMLTAYHASNWHPLTWLSHAVDYAIWGLNPTGHHLTSILIHGLNTFLVVILITKLVCYANQAQRDRRHLMVRQAHHDSAVTSESSRTDLSLSKGISPSRHIGRGDKGEGAHSDNTPLIAGAVTGLLFGLHPLHVESVVWVSERKDVLYAFFYLLSVLVYLRYVSSPPFNSPLAKGGYRGMRRWHWYSVCLLFFILSLLSKPMAVTLPVVLIILDIYPLRRLQIPLCPPFLKGDVIRSPLCKSRYDSIPRGVRGDFLKSAFSGQRQALLEKIPFIVLSTISSIITIKAQQAGGAIKSLELYPVLSRLLISMRALLFYYYKIIWPVDLAPLYPYPPGVSLYQLEYTGTCIGVVGITVFSVWMWRRQEIILSVWIFYVVSLLPVLGILQVGDQAAADRYTYLPSLGPFILISLGTVKLMKKFDTKKYVFASVKFTIFIGILFFTIGVLSILTIRQIKIWRNTTTLWNSEIKLFPDYNVAYINMGIAYRKSDKKQAIKYFDKAVGLSPRDSLGYYERGMTYLQLGLYHKAISDLNTAITLKPQNYKFYNGRGIIYGILGNYKQAIKDCDTAVRLAPEYSPAYYNRAMIYKSMSDHRRVIGDLQTAARLDDYITRKLLSSQNIKW